MQTFDKVEDAPQKGSDQAAYARKKGRNNEAEDRARGTQNRPSTTTIAQVVILSLVVLIMVYFGHTNLSDSRSRAKPIGTPSTQVEQVGSLGDKYVPVRTIPERERQKVDTGYHELNERLFELQSARPHVVVQAFKHLGEIRMPKTLLQYGSFLTQYIADLTKEREDAAKTTATATIGADGLHHTNVTRKPGEDPHLIVAVALALLNLHHTNEAGAAEFTKYLKSPDVELKTVAALKLGYLGERAVPFLDLFGTLAEDKDVRVRRSAAEAYASLGSYAEAAHDHIQKLVKDTDKTVRLFATQAKRSVSVVPKDRPRKKVETEYQELGRWLYELQSAQPLVVSTAYHDLGRVRMRQTIVDYGKFLHDYLEDGKKHGNDRHLLVALALAMLSLSHGAGEGRTKLQSFLKSSDVEMKTTAALKLGFLGEPAVPFLDLIGNQCDDEDVRVRRGAAEALASMGSYATPANEHVKKMLQDPDSEVRLFASEAIGHTSPGDMHFIHFVPNTTADGHEDARGPNTISRKEKLPSGEVIRGRTHLHEHPPLAPAPAPSSKSDI